jgi:hypothetical protein
MATSKITPKLTKHITVKLLGSSSNVYSSLSLCRKALMKSDVEDKEKVWDFIRIKATSGDYDHAMQTLMKWFNIE